MNPANPLLPKFDKEQRWSDRFGVPDERQVGADLSVSQITEFQGRLVILSSSAGGVARFNNHPFASIMLFNGRYWRSAGAKFIGSINLLAADKEGLLLSGALRSGFNADGAEIPLQTFAHWDGITWTDLSEGIGEIIRIQKANGTFYVLGTINNQPHTLAKLTNKTWTPIAQLAVDNRLGNLKIIEAPRNFVVSNDEAIFLTGSFESAPVPIRLSNGEPSEFVDKHTVVGFKGGKAIFRASSRSTIHLSAAVKDEGGYVLGGNFKGSFQYKHPGFELQQTILRRNGKAETITFHRAKQPEKGIHFDSFSNIFRISSDGETADPLDGGIVPKSRRSGGVLSMAVESSGRVIVGGKFEVVGPDNPEPAISGSPEKIPNIPGEPPYEGGIPPAINPESKGFNPSATGTPANGLAFLTGNSWAVPDHLFRVEQAALLGASPTSSNSFSSSVSTILIGPDSDRTYIGGSFLGTSTILLRNIAVLVDKALAPLVNHHHQGVLSTFRSFSSGNNLATVDSKTGDIYYKGNHKRAGDLSNPEALIRFSQSKNTWNNLPTGPFLGKLESMHINRSGGATDGHLYVLASPSLDERSRFRDDGGLFRFDGTKWHKITPLTIARMSQLVVDRNDRVYAAGSGLQFLDSNDREVNRSAFTFFDGKEWRKPGSVFKRFSRSGFVSQMVLHGNTVYLAGRFIRVGSISALHVAAFDGFRFQAFGKGVRLKDKQEDLASVSNIVVGLDGLVYITGNFNEAVNADKSVVPVNGMAVWNGKNWGNWSGGLDNFNEPRNADRIFELTATRKGILVIGDFEKIAGLDINNFARWDGLEWHPIEPPFLTNINSNTKLLSTKREMILAGDQLNASLLSSLTFSSYDLQPDKDQYLRVDPVFEPNFAPLNIDVTAPEGGNGQLEIFVSGDLKFPVLKQPFSGGHFEWDGLIEVPFSDESRDGKPVALVSGIHSPLLIRATFGDTVLEGMVEIDPYLRFEADVSLNQRKNLLKSIRLASGFNESEVRLQGDQVVIESTRRELLLGSKSKSAFDGGSRLYRSYLKHLAEFAILRLDASPEPEPQRSFARHEFKWNYELPAPPASHLPDPILQVLIDLNA